MLRRSSRPPYTSSPATKAARIPRTARVPAGRQPAAAWWRTAPPPARRPARGAPHRRRTLRAGTTRGRSAHARGRWHRSRSPPPGTARYRPAVPLYWRAAPARRPRTSHRRFRPRSAPRPRHRGDRPPRPTAMSSRCWSSQTARDSRCCSRCGPAMPDRLGDRPAVVIVQFHQQPVHHLAAALPGLPPGKAPGYLPQQVRQQRGPGLIGYRGSSDCRVLVVSHKPIMIAAAAPLRGPSDLRQQPHGHELQLPYLTCE